MSKINWLAVIGVLVGCVVGFLSHDGIMKLISGREDMSESKEIQSSTKFTGMSGINPGVFFTEPSGTTVNDKLDNAHRYSIAFRQKVGYCPVLPSTTVNLDPKALGFTEITLAHSIDLLSAIWDIQKTDVNTSFIGYRLINGLIDDQSKLMVVPLINGGVPGGAVRKIEKTDNGDRSLIRILDNSLECPILCDFVGSKIINGTGAPSPCQ